MSVPDPSDGAFAIAKFCSLHSLQSLSLEESSQEVEWWPIILRNLNLPTLVNVDFFQSDSYDEGQGLERVNSLAFADFFSRHPQLTVAKLVVPSEPIPNFNQPEILPNLLTYRGDVLDVLGLLRAVGPRRLKEVNIDETLQPPEDFGQPLVNPSRIELEVLSCGVQWVHVSHSAFVSSPLIDLIVCC